MNDPNESIKAVNTMAKTSTFKDKAIRNWEFVVRYPSLIDNEEILCHVSRNNPLAICKSKTTTIAFIHKSILLKARLIKMRELYPGMFDDISPKDKTLKINCTTSHERSYKFIIEWVKEVKSFEWPIDSTKSEKVLVFFPII